MDLPRAWLVLAFGDHRQYAGNAGYEDVISREYRYDTNVPNHKRVAVGDVLVIREPEGLAGFALVEEIREEPATKQRLRCPVCRTSALKRRERRTPVFRCDNGHEFDAPEVEAVSVTQFTAVLGDSFLPAPVAVPLADLTAACPRWNGQLAIQELELGRLPLERLPGFSERILEKRPRPRLEPLDAADPGTAPYQLSPGDRRALALRQVRERRGQERFRRLLIDRYGATCVISGCTLVDVLEAAHIRPYRGDDDHHPENGLLLRADLHTLFDLDLLGVHPVSLQVHVNASVTDGAYRSLQGTVVRCGDLRPSAPALEARWSEFLVRSRS
jgi:hypothetical protein